MKRSFTREERKVYERERKREQRAKKRKSVNADAVIGLQNNAENVCFGNVVMQLLRPLGEFHRQLETACSLNNCVRNLKQVFTKMNEGNSCVRASAHYRAMKIRDYTVNAQYDCHEFFNYLLEEVYGSIANSDCMFTIVTKSFVACGRGVCGHTTIPTVVSNTCLTLNVHTGACAQSVIGLLRESLKGEYVADYTCDSCHHIGSCSKTVTLENCPSVLLMQLNLFRNDGEKIKPCLAIEREIDEFGLSVELRGVIYHIGGSIDEGHYTCSVKVDGTWYYVNDSIVHREVPTLRCSFNERCVPYMLMYNRKEVKAMLLSL